MLVFKGSSTAARSDGKLATFHFESTTLGMKGLHLQRSAIAVTAPKALRHIHSPIGGCCGFGVLIEGTMTHLEGAGFEHGDLPLTNSDPFVTSHLAVFPTPKCQRQSLPPSKETVSIIDFVAHDAVRKRETSGITD